MIPSPAMVDTPSKGHSGGGSSVIDREAIAEDHASRGNIVAAIDELSKLNRHHRSAAIERRLVELRRAGFRRTRPGMARPASGELARSSPLGDTVGLPLVPPSLLDAGTVRHVLATHGALLCPKLFRQQHVERMTTLIDKAFAARDAVKTGDTFEPGIFEPLPDIAPQGRKFMGEAGMYVCDSPRALFELLEIYSELGLLQMMERYFGESVAMMPQKCTLRRVSPLTPDERERLRAIDATDPHGTWHQDGAILGAEHGNFDALDIWVALSPCGRHAPSLEVVPEKLDYMLPTRTGQAVGPVSLDTIRTELPHTGPVLAQLEPGDAILMDQFTVHGTGYREDMTEVRYSVEGWFFGASDYPEGQPGFVV